ncbi:MAG: hypothetical protein IJW05_15050, partial [Lentisphaeria bacterium]|nr:hypothetical protein [Lentisphaeria bacterium]
VGAVLAAVILSGCGHNVINYGDGVGFDAGINPENGTFSFNLRYGKILSAVTRDNVEIEMSGQADASGNVTPSIAGASSGQPAGKGNTGVNTSGALRVKIGRQINGYTVDAIKAGADSKQIMDMK